MSTNASRPEMKWNRYDTIVAGLVALLAVAVAVWFYVPKAHSGAVTVVISAGGETVEQVKLTGFTEKTITHNGYTLHIAAEDGGIRVEESDCPTQDCVHTGTITRAGQSIVCLPAQIVIHLEGAADSDAPDVIVG